MKIRKNSLLLILVLLLALGLTACQSRDAAPDETESAADTIQTEESSGEEGEESETDRNVLVAYFSHTGNTEEVAQIIAEYTGGDLFAIETVQEYPTTHDSLLEFAYEEKAENARPKLSSRIENFDSYNTIFLGYPNWNADLPMPLYTFLEEYDFAGKTIIPFTTHGGSGFSRTIQTISELQPEATVISEGLSISRNNVAGSESEVASWLGGLEEYLP